MFLADRGFADTQLMGHLRDLGWHWRIRIKSNFWIHPTHVGPLQVGDVEPQSGPRSFWHGVAMTDKHSVRCTLLSLGLSAAKSIGM